VPVAVVAMPSTSTMAVAFFQTPEVSFVQIPSAQMRRLSRIAARRRFLIFLLGSYPVLVR
jgi:hypothetical protein